MASTTSIHSNAFNFLSFIRIGVDPRTGQYTVSLSFPEIKSNNLNGPALPLGLSFNPLNTLNTGFGLGWEIQLSQYDTNIQVLSLSSGETFKVTGVTGNRLDMQEQKIKSFIFTDLGSNRFQVVHKSGMVEILRQEGRLALPETIYSPEGYKINLAYQPYGNGLRRLHTVTDGQGVVLLQINLPEAGRKEIEVLLRPDGNPGGALARFVMKLRDNGPGDELYEIVLPTEEQASWRFNYRAEKGLHCITEVWTPVGGHETIEYDGNGHGFPGNAQAPLPRVSKHLIDPGFGQARQEVRYSYTNSSLPNDGHNFLGNGANITWRNNGLDNLYQVIERYLYGTTETHYADSVAVRTIERTFNRYHLLTLERTTQGSNVHEVFTTYYADDNPDLPFSSQSPNCQLAKSVETRWSVGSASRSEKVLTSYDTHGNLTEEIQANGIKETSSYFPVAGVPGECPPDPAGFVRSLREKTVTPAPGQQAGAPVLRTLHRYDLMPALKGTTQDPNIAWLVLTHEELFQVDGNQQVPLQQLAYRTINQPDNSLLHGRREQETLTLNGLTTTTDYAYEKLNSAFVGETVLQTTQTVTGYDHGVDGRHTVKIINTEDSLLHGQPLLTHDDLNTRIRNKYDRLHRVVQETVAPEDQLYEGSRLYGYGLTNAPGQQAFQIATDVKGVQTRSLVSGLNQVIHEQRQDPDNRSGTQAEAFRDIYFAQYNALGQLEEETELDWCSADPGDDVKLSSRFTYDNWGEQISVLRPDGVLEHEVNDPITLVKISWIEGMGKTATLNNLFEKPVWVKRYAKGVDPSDPNAVPLSEHHYECDGLGRTTREIDALGQPTSYTYDVYDRMVLSTLPDDSVVERRYALHSSEDLPTWIGVNGKELGQQLFDGLDRMIQSITGGRLTTYTFNPGQTQPSTVIRPSLAEVVYRYAPALSEEPLERLTNSGIKAEYKYDGQNARLLSCQENGLTLARDYFSNGETKTETRSDTSGGTFTMHYHYSRQARLLSYTDVLEQVQQHVYNKSTGLLESTTLGTTMATFTYNAQGLTETIHTTDGALSLKVSLAYDDFGRETLREFDYGSAPAQQLIQVYNEVDGLIERTLQEKDSGEVLRHETYGYDVRGRLELYECYGTQQPVDPYGKPIDMQLFEFDDIDNIVLVKTWFAEGNNTADYAFDNPEDPAQLTSVTNSHADYTAYIGLGYNANGEMTEGEDELKYKYDDNGRLISVSGGGGGNAETLEYDPLDTLVRKDDEQRHYQAGQLSNVTQGARSSTFLRGNDEVLAERQDGAGPKS